MKRTLALLLFLCSLGASTPARADGDACSSSYDEALAARKAQRLRRARQMFVQCAQPECPALLRKECVEGVRANDTSLPTVAFRVRDAEGHDVTNVRVFVDDELLTEELRGNALPVDPGPHRFRFETNGRDPATLDQVLVVEGEKSRVLTVTFPPTATTSTGPTENRAGGHPSYGIVRNVAFGVAAVGLVTATVSGIVVLDKAKTIKDSCTNGTCPPEHHGDLDAATTFATVSTVAFIGAGVSLAIGIGAAILAAGDHRSNARVACSAALDFCLRP